MVKKIKNLGPFVQFGTIIGSLSPIATAFAASIDLPNPLGCAGGADFMHCVVTPVINFLFVLAVPICAIMVLWGGFQMMTSAGDPEKFSSGRQTIVYAAVGFLVVLLANSVATIIQNMFQ